MKPSRILLLALCLGSAPMCLGNKPFCYPNGNCYTVLLSELQFNNASQGCGPKGSLATMKSEQEKREILQLATHFLNRGNVSEFWIGLHLLPKNCTVNDKILYGFTWITGEEETEVSLWDKKPKISCVLKKKCVILQNRWSSTNSGDGKLTWVWKNDKCGRKLPSICRYPTDFAPAEDMDIFSPPTTDSTMKLTSPPILTTKNIPSTINVLCREFLGNETLTCEIANIPYSCNNTHCFCGHLDYKGGGYGMRRCQGDPNESCLSQCIMSSNISCVCKDHQTSCDRAECTIDESITTMSTSLVVGAPSSSSFSDDENLFEKLVIPLILGLVAFGILVMLIWGGVQMCVRKKKPKRKKSIIPTVEPEPSDTDSTDNSSSDEEEGESQDMAEMA